MSSEKLAAAIRNAVIAAALAAAAPAALADKPPVYTSVFSNVAVGGYDPVSYFDGTPVQGDKSVSTTWMGAEFRFASTENRDRFLSDPAHFAPQYGGYCAWAVAQGKTAKGDPEFWKIVDDKLYLNYNAKVQKDWEQDVPGFIKAANGQWPDVLK